HGRFPSSPTGAKHEHRCRAKGETVSYAVIGSSAISHSSASCACVRARTWTPGCSLQRPGAARPAPAPDGDERFPAVESLTGGKRKTGPVAPPRKAWHRLCDPRLDVSCDAGVFKSKRVLILCILCLRNQSSSFKRNGGNANNHDCTTHISMEWSVCCTF
ncbi:putative Rho GTPase-activating protein, partial [Frankliniella fusca]